MSVYSLSKIQLETGSVVSQYDWHPINPFLAVSSHVGNKVTVYAEDGERVCSYKKTEPCTALKWHPKFPLLLCGWRSGVVTSSTLDGSQVELGPTHEQSEITMILWTPAGTHACTGMKNGSVAIWFCSGSGSMNLLFVHRTDQAVTLGVCMSTAKPPAQNAIVPLNEGEDTADGEVPNRKDGEAEGMTVMDDDSEAPRQATFAVVCGRSVEAFDDQGNGYHLFEVDKDVHVATLLWVQGKSNIVCLTSALQVLYFNIQPGFNVNFLFKMKISGSTNEISLIHAVWANPGVLVTSCGESVLRVWNLEEQDMYVLPIPSGEDNPNIASPDKPIITDVAFNATKCILSACTRSGRIVVWQYVGGPQSTKPEDWDPLTVQEAEAPVQKLCWGSEGMLCVVSSDAVRILVEVQIKRRLREQCMVSQTGVDSFIIQTFSPHALIPVKTALGKIKGLDVLYPNVVLWSGKKVELYQINDVSQTASLQQTMDESSSLIALSWQGLFVARRGKVEMFTLQFQRTGTPLSINESEGDPVAIDSNEEYLAVATDQNMVRVWRVGRDIKLLGTPRMVLDTSQTDLEINSIRLNTKGKKVSLLARRRDDYTMDTRVWVYDLDGDRSMCFDFGPMARFPNYHAWMCKGGDSTVDIEHTLLCVETCKFKASEESSDIMGSRLGIVTLYVSVENGIVQQSAVGLPPNTTCFVGLNVPNLLFYSKRRIGGGGKESHTHHMRLHDLEGINVDADIKVREAMLKFSYNLTIGNMDEAYRVVKSVKDESVWVSMATMCVKTRRLDVAEVCLGNMQDPMSAKLLKASYDEPEIEARVAMLAICLGMTEEAEKLYKQCGRYDLLNRLYRVCGRFDAALEVAEKNDRIHLRTTRYLKARFHESKGEFEIAAKFYEASMCHRTEVPRMYYENRRMYDLELFVRQAQDPELIGWWGQYQESLGNLQNALGLYERSGDTFNRVRLLCAQNPPNLEGAMALVQAGKGTPQGRAAAFHLARQYEEIRQINQAIELFEMAGAIKHTIRIARENDMINEVLTQSLKSSESGVLLDSAAYFEDKNHVDKAVQLYHKGGDLQKAVDLCVTYKLFDVLQTIAENLDASADPEVFQSCAEFFTSHGQFDKAVIMLTQAKAYNEALQLCLERNVKLTEEIAEAMTLPKTDNDEDEEYRIGILKKIAKVAKAQESWHLACKKYTQAGEKVKAMKMLLRSGETDKIVFFANHARQKELYILAANYLQKCDWQNDAAIYKNILLFYNKAHAYDSLAVFYDMCSQVQIDEYRDYEKASVTLRESGKCLEKCADSVPPTRMAQLKVRLTFIEKFANARRLAQQGTAAAGSEMVSLCQDLLSRYHVDHPEYEIFSSAVRVGDVYALLVEHYVQTTQWEHAHTIIEKMREGKIELSYYLETSLVENVYHMLGLEFKPVASQRQVQHPGSPGIEENIPETVDDD